MRVTACISVGPRPPHTPILYGIVLWPPTLTLVSPNTSLGLQSRDWSRRCSQGESEAGREPHSPPFGSYFRAATSALGAPLLAAGHGATRLGGTQLAGTESYGSEWCERRRSVVHLFLGYLVLAFQVITVPVHRYGKDA